ncbi:hypothetical protein HBO25_06240 [Pseudomonas nitroreducens]|nr:hypothetical protein [Pseudomonas nitroreducens]
MGRNTKGMKSSSASSSVQISYRRDDGNLYKYQCKIDDTSAVWRAFLSDTGTWGRWRNSYEMGDARTSYSIANGVLSIENDQLGTKTFTKKDF